MAEGGQTAPPSRPLSLSRSAIPAQPSLRSRGQKHKAEARPAPRGSAPHLLGTKALGTRLWSPRGLSAMTRVALHVSSHPPLGRAGAPSLPGPRTQHRAADDAGASLNAARLGLQGWGPCLFTADALLDCSEGCLLFRDFIYLLTGGRGRQISMCERKGTWLATQAHALTGNQPCDLSLCRMPPNPPSHTGQG